MAQVRLALRLWCFTHRPSHSHSAHASTSTGPIDPSSPRPTSPSVEGKHSTPTGSTNGKSDGAVYFECLNCKRQVSLDLLCFPVGAPSPTRPTKLGQPTAQIASSRYAPHLSSCMGVGNGNRRGGSRNPITKSKSVTDSRRAPRLFLTNKKIRWRPRTLRVSISWFRGFR